MNISDVAETSAETQATIGVSASTLQAINVDTNKPLEIIQIGTNLFKTKMASENEKATQKTPDKSKDPLKWLQSQFIEVEVCSTDTPTLETAVTFSTEVQEEPLNQGDDDSRNPNVESCDYSLPVKSHSENSTNENDGIPKGSGQGYVEGVSNPLDICFEKVKKMSFGNVDSDMEYDEEIKKYKCKRCEKYFKVKTSITHHLRNICVENPRYRCAYCPYTAKVAVSLRVHYARYHNHPGTMVPSDTIPSTVKPKGKSRRKKKKEPLVEDIIEQAAKKAQIEELESVPECEPSTSQKQAEVGPEGKKEKEFDYDDDTDTFTCRTCKIKLKTKLGVENHIKNNCSADKVKTHKCFFCPYTARSSARVRVHSGHAHGKWPRLDRYGVWNY